MTIAEERHGCKTAVQPLPAGAFQATFPAIMANHCVIQLARFGDLVQTRRLIASLQAEPGAAVHLCVDRSLAGLARIIYPGVTVHALDAHAGGAGEGSIASNTDAMRGMASVGFEAVYNLNFSGLNLALARLFDPAVVRGHRNENGQAMKDGWTSLGFRWTRHRISSPLNLVDFWALLADNPVCCAELTPAATPGGRGLGVVMAGRESRRSLPPELSARVAAAVAQRLGSSRVVLLGGQTEKGLAREFLSHAPAKLAGICENLCGRTDWAGLCEALQGLDLVLTPDTGAMHLAVHLGVPVEAFFLSNAWAWETGPYGPGHRVWQGVQDCSPCVESQPCPYKIVCLAPFTKPAFLRALQKDAQAAEPLQGLLLLEGECDALGGTYRVQHGRDPAAVSRASVRCLLAEWRGIEPPTAPDNAAAGSLFHERDWALAQRSGIE